MPRHVLIEVPDITTIPQYVTHGLGVAFMPAAFAESVVPRVRAAPPAGRPGRSAW
ncbi:hypothetical protein [Spongiactinospora gelatinilytica]|uniref:hypothetical protein n=1 Tax=Spongiactinospora gelatinilytica TaxID=2666298 RepID=UPI001314CA50|nr:hypothetical protein [Spongiactinospora gelatinilytica]